MNVLVPLNNCFSHTFFYILIHTFWNEIKHCQTNTCGITNNLRFILLFSILSYIFFLYILFFFLFLSKYAKASKNKKKYVYVKVSGKTHNILYINVCIFYFILFHFIFFTFSLWWKCNRVCLVKKFVFLFLYLTESPFYSQLYIFLSFFGLPILIVFSLFILEKELLRFLKYIIIF